MIEPYFKSEDRRFTLLHNDTFSVLSKFDFEFDMVFSDPPYFLSNDGLTVKNGKISSVNKGVWDKSLGDKDIYTFNYDWLSLVRDKMKDDATIWVSGTVHNIYTIISALKELDFKILNVITWEKTNPPPNFSCRFFTHSTEQIVWARKKSKVPHYFNYELMKKINSDKQMKDVWKFSAVSKWEKKCGKHPTQKSLPLLTRIILASTKSGAWVLDPFCGSGTSGVAANLLNRKFLGIDENIDYLKISKARKKEIDSVENATVYKDKIKDLKFISPEQYINEEPATYDFIDTVFNGGG